jgi:transcriptional regulator with XRE-family HTH domain
MTTATEDPRTDRTPGEPERLWRTVVGELLRDTRTGRGETLVETARRAGVSPQYLSEMERGRKEASSEMLAAVSGALGLTLLDLTLGVAERITGDAGPATMTVRTAYALAA